MYHIKTEKLHKKYYIDNNVQGVSYVFGQFYEDVLRSLSDLTAVFFETGAMSTPTKSRNLTNCG